MCGGDRSGGGERVLVCDGVVKVRRVLFVSSVRERFGTDVARRGEMLVEHLR